jgi:hypothetical protein
MSAAADSLFTPEARQLLAQSGSYRDFLRVYFRETNLSYAEVARRGGFSSRSYPRDVTEGRRRLTAKSLPSLSRGLRLDPALSRLLQSLYFSEYPDEHPETLTAQALRTRLERERLDVARSQRRGVRRKTQIPETSKLGDRDLTHLAAGLTDVVAALGELKDGATLDEIQKRTGLGKNVLARQLDSLVREGVLDYAGDSRRYFPGTAHIDWTGQAGNRLARAVYVSAAERLAETARGHFARPDAMFVNSAVSIPREDLPRFKEELKELLLKFVDRSVETGASPDTVVQIVAGMFEGRLAPPRTF